MKTINRWTLLACAVSAAQVSAEQNEIRQLYLYNCASCHGKNYGGGMAPSMRDDEWVNGGTVAAVADAIANGLPERGMPAWTNALSDKQITAMATMIVEAGKEQGGSSVSNPQVFESERHNFTMDTVLSTDGVIWAFDFMPDGSLIFTERNGDLMHFHNGELQRIEGTPDVWHYRQGGLLDVYLDPDYEDNGWVYLSYSQKTGKNDKGTDTGSLVIVRGQIDNGQWVNEQHLYAPPKEQHINRGWHFGSRFAIQGDYLFFSYGDEGYRERAQDVDIQNGKIHRIHKDGAIPEDNPFVDDPNGLDTIWSYGHRNPQGLVFSPDGKTLWSTEHGPKGGDELNRVMKAENYGWPKVSFGINYDGTTFTEHTTMEGMVDPVHHWTPSIAAAGMNFYTADKFDQWQGDLFVASLALQELHRLRLKDGEVMEDEIVLKNEGRIRDVTTAPDGTLYIAINDNENNVHRIVSLVPAN